MDDVRAGTLAQPQRQTTKQQTSYVVVLSTSNSFLKVSPTGARETVGAEWMHHHTFDAAQVESRSTKRRLCFQALGRKTAETIC